MSLASVQRSDLADPPKQLGVKIRRSISRRLSALADLKGVRKSDLAEQAFIELLEREEAKAYATAKANKQPL